MIPFGLGAQVTKQTIPTITVALPSIPELEISIADFGGVGDGTTDNTRSFERAIDYLVGQGGGRLKVGSGVWLTGPIEMKSRVELNIARDAVIAFTADKDAYPIVRTEYEGEQTWRCQSPLWAKGAEDIAVTGSGIVDGNGDSWRDVRRSEVNSDEWRRITSSGGLVADDGNRWYPSEQYMNTLKSTDGQTSNAAARESAPEQIRDFLRPTLVKFDSCKRVLIEGVTFQNSPAWNIHTLMVDDLTVRKTNVRNPEYAHNGDGIDVESCCRVAIEQCTFDVGDDAICIKSGKDSQGRERGRASEQIRVDQCTVYRGHGGFVVGSEMSGGVNNIVVSNCLFCGTDTGLRFKSGRGRGGLVENIFIERITMKDIVGSAITFDLFYTGKPKYETQNGKPTSDLQAEPFDQTTPRFGNISIDNVVCSGAERAMSFNGLPETRITNIRITNSSINARRGASICEAEGVELENVKIVRTQGAALELNNVGGFVARGITAAGCNDRLYTTTGSRNGTIEITTE